MASKPGINTRWMELMATGQRPYLVAIFKVNETYLTFNNLMNRRSRVVGSTVLTSLLDLKVILDWFIISTTSSGGRLGSRESSHGHVRINNTLPQTSASSRRWPRAVVSSALAIFIVIVHRASKCARMSHGGKDHTDKHHRSKEDMRRLPIDVPNKLIWLCHFPLHTAVRAGNVERPNNAIIDIAGCAEPTSPDVHHTGSI
mmetsp:Transcript_27780/g.61817  ORF Transcript_27780/g.61817 Transcript_27780/m.61817 type:complete len:201 (-) Transcript_27780:193-795(-)